MKKRRAVFVTLAVCVLLFINPRTLSAVFGVGPLSGILRGYAWAAVIVVAAALGLAAVRRESLRKPLRLSLLVMTNILAVEVVCMLAFKHVYGIWHFEQAGSDMFVRHPYLVGVPRPGARASQGETRISHNRFGLRGAPLEREKAPGVHRIVTVGGSTTYCKGVSDDETWPAILDRLLGPSYEVINLGVPGYSSAEHVIQAALCLSDWQADTVIYYMGWNDLRNMHVDGLQSDYSRFHGRTQYGNLQLPRVWTGPNLASVRVAVFVLRRMGWLMSTPDQLVNAGGRPSAGIDTRLVSLYERNTRSLIALSRAQGLEPVMIPQVVNERALDSSVPGDWVPYVRPKDIPHLLGALNRRMVRVAAAERCPALTNIVTHTWQAGDFIDDGHFSGQGNATFARLVARHFRDE